MYHMNGGTLQKDLVTHYNAAGQKTKQFWFWNGESRFHNVETFYYSRNGLPSSLIDSFADGNIEITTYYYDSNRNLKKRVTLNKKDTIDFWTYPNKHTTIQRWYMEGKPYRFDTAIYEAETAMLEYFGTNKSQNAARGFKWHYKFKNKFDGKGNLVTVYAKVEKPYNSFTKYIYNKRGLLLKKQEIISVNKKKEIQTEYYFKYDK
ncbi:hypothetical protein A4D02_28815 [Niastella koreensis]|uniref:Uncharacterized protein n=3 Tax=Niastella koreensis TaxID=354356 RepID=G8T772_NIAKG|nr:hypothetical protein Niako_3803 [Niastella koreensis GR20-10]OQP49595.1 hypothetical protein A4D02_28815 [Niastella koreensis]